MVYKKNDDRIHNGKESEFSHLRNEVPLSSTTVASCQDETSVWIRQTGLTASEWPD